LPPHYLVYFLFCEMIAQKPKTFSELFVKHPNSLEFCEARRRLAGRGGLELPPGRGAES